MSDKTFPPTYMYHAEHGARIFTSEAELKDAGGGWVDTPAKLQPPGADPAGEPAAKAGKTKAK